MDKYRKIEKKHYIIIDKAIQILNYISDYEHNIYHTLDVVEYTKELLDKTNIKVDIEVCIICAYWHDVGRIKSDINHEEISANMLKEEMIDNNYDLEFIDKCYQAIINHKWNMQPTTNEGLIIKDADKLAFLGKNRWKECLKYDYKLDEIIKLLPKLKNEILYFNESREIYDRLIIELVSILYKKIYKE